MRLLTYELIFLYWFLVLCRLLLFLFVSSVLVVFFFWLFWCMVTFRLFPRSVRVSVLFLLEFFCSVSAFLSILSIYVAICYVSLYWLLFSCFVVFALVILLSVFCNCKRSKRYFCRDFCHASCLLGSLFFLLFIFLCHVYPSFWLIIVVLSFGHIAYVLLYSVMCKASKRHTAFIHWRYWRITCEGTVWFAGDIDLWIIVSPITICDLASCYIVARSYTIDSLDVFRALTLDISRS